MAEFIAWFFVNALVPIFSPLVLLVLLKVPRFYSGLSQGIVTRALKDGQLFWTVIPMAAAASYEAGVALGDPTVKKWVAWVALVYHFLVIVGSAVLVMLGTEASASEAQQNGRIGSDGKEPPAQVSGAPQRSPH